MVFHAEGVSQRSIAQAVSDELVLLEDSITGDRDKMLNADRFLKIVDKYVAIQALNPEIM